MALNSGVAHTSAMTPKISMHQHQINQAKKNKKKKYKLWPSAVTTRGNDHPSVRLARFGFAIILTELPQPQIETATNQRSRGKSSV